MGRAGRKISQIGASVKSRSALIARYPHPLPRFSGAGAWKTGSTRVARVSHDALFELAQLVGHGLVRGDHRGDLAVGEEHRGVIPVPEHAPDLRVGALGQLAAEIHRVLARE